MEVILQCILCVVYVNMVYGTGPLSEQYLVAVEKTKITQRPGRHVCTTEKVVSRPIPVMQTYKKPVYTSHPRDCPNLASCPQYDVKYIPANRTIYQLQKYSNFEHNCCPGWTKTHKREKGCMEAICTNGCGEFGICIKPEVCQCRIGYAGDMCDTDIDECKGKEHGCSQICKNTAGSYMCACQEGFVLAPDGKTCNFCFTCQKEYSAMMNMISSLQKDLIVQTEIQALKAATHSNMTLELETLKKEISTLQTINEKVEQMHNNATSELKELKSKVLTLTQENQELKEEIQTLEKNQTILGEEMEVLRSAPPPLTTRTPTTKATTPTMTTTTTSTTSTSSYPSTSENHFGLQFDTQAMIQALSNQLGLMEEKLDLCNCRERWGA